MKILVINQYFPPDSSATAAVFQDIVRVLDRRRHEVTVVCGRPSYIPSEKQRWRPLRVEQRGRVRIERIGSTVFDRRRISLRAINYLTFLVGAALRAVMSRPSAVIVGSDPPLVIWVAILAAKGRPVIYSLQDLHPHAALTAEMVREGHLTTVWRKLHAAGLKRCDLVVCLGETMASIAIEEGAPPDRVVVIHNGAELPTSEPDAQAVAELRGDANFVAVHAGNIGIAGAWETVLKAATILEGEARFVFVGGGSREDDLRSVGGHVVPFLPPDRLSAVMAAGDLQVVTLRYGMEGLVVPSKLYTALAHGRPVLAVVPRESEVAKVVEHWGCGLVADPEDPEDVVAKCRWAMENEEVLRDMSAAAAEAGRHYERHRCMTSFVDHVERVVAAEGGGRR